MTTMQELLSEGEIKGEKNAILRFLKNRFGEVPQTISDAVNAYNDWLR